jgi:MFS family permease
MTDTFTRRDASTEDAQTTMTARQRLTVCLLLGAGFMLSVDFSILNVALPRIGAAVGLDWSALPWVATAYTLPAAGFTLLFGRIADLYGRRRLFLGGMALLCVSSSLGGLATSPLLLLGARALQGFATAVATPAALSLLTTTFSDEKQRAQVLGINGAILSGGFVVGALAGGAIVDALSWRWAFLINVPVALVILVVTPFLVPASRAPARVPLDVPGALTVTLGLLAFVFGVTTGNPYALLAGVALLVAFVWIEQRAKSPLVALSILSRPPVKWGNLAGLVVFSMETGLIFLMTLYLQDVLRLSPSSTGLVFGVPGLASVVAGIIAGRFIARHGSRNVLACGLLVQAAATAPLIGLGAGSGWLAVLVPALFVGFFGHVTAIVAYMASAISFVPDQQQGLATGLASMTQQIGCTIGIPILGALAATQSTLLGGMRVALAVNVLVSLTALALVWRGLRPRRVERSVLGAVALGESSA